MTAHHRTLVIGPVRTSPSRGLTLRDGAASLVGKMVEARSPGGGLHTGMVVYVRDGYAFVDPRDGLEWFTWVDDADRWVVERWLNGAIHLEESTP